MTLKRERTACMHQKYVCFTNLYVYIYIEIYIYTSIPGLDQCNTNQNMQNCGSILHSLKKKIKTVFPVFYKAAVYCHNKIVSS